MIPVWMMKVHHAHSSPISAVVSSPLPGTEEPMSQQEQWQVAGNAAENYERYLVPSIFGPWAATLIELANPQPGERLLDVACGTGIVARLASNRVGSQGRVVGLDLNPTMLAVARALPSSTSITWQEGSALALPFPDETFDVVCCQQSLQYFPDQAAALGEMYRVLVPEGRLALAVWQPIEHSPGFASLAQALERYVSPEAAALARAPFALGNAEELQTLITEASFRDVVIRPAVKTLHFPSVEAFVQHYVAGSPLAGLVAQVDDGARTALLEEVQAKLASYVDEGLGFPIEAHLATATR